MKLAITAALTALLIGPATAQHLQQHHGHGQHKPHTPAPYAGFQQREVKALSEQQIADLRQGRGMGLALAAELNGYPGPMHVLELKDELQLTAEQLRQFQDLFNNMRHEAIRTGELLIAREIELDRAFADGMISEELLNVVTTNIGQTQARLRAIHLRYHLTSAELLSEQQRRRYAELRGYR